MAFANQYLLRGVRNSETISRSKGEGLHSLSLQYSRISLRER